MASLFDVTRDDLAVLLDGEPAFRLTQLWEGLYANLQDPDDILTLPKALRERLATALPSALELTTTSISDSGDTVKFLWSLRDGGHPIETVLMHYRDRATVCVSGSPRRYRAPSSSRRRASATPATP